MEFLINKNCFFFCNFFHTHFKPNKQTYVIDLVSLFGCDSAIQYNELHFPRMPSHRNSLTTLRL